MTQQEVLDVLKKNKKWMTSGEIAKKLGITQGAVAKNLNSLFKAKEVYRKDVKRVWKDSNAYGRNFIWKIR
jgi:predicted transcriptional regulator